MGKPTKIIVHTKDGDQEHFVKGGDKAGALFDAVIRQLGLKKVPLFGLEYQDSKGDIAWLEMKKKIFKQDIMKPGAGKDYEFTFMAMYYPENVEELNHPVIERLFFLQVKEQIVNDSVYCPPEMCVLLASYAIQAEFGKDPPADIKATDLLPKRIINQHSYSDNDWIQKVLQWHSQHTSMSREMAAIEYLRIAQDLDMYGIQYFEIANKKGTPLWLGVHSWGLNVYLDSDRVTPKLGFPWTEIRNISYNDKKFKIKMIDKNAPDFGFVSKRLKTNKRILALCIGNHQFYMHRRRSQPSLQEEWGSYVQDQEKNKALRGQLGELEGELGAQADASKATVEDKIHQENKAQGRDKFKTLKAASAGASAERIEQFENIDDDDI
jgi:moesin